MGSIVKGLARNQNKILELRIHVFPKEAEEDALVTHKTEMFFHRCPAKHGRHQTQTAVDGKASGAQPSHQDTEAQTDCKTLEMVFSCQLLFSGCIHSYYTLFKSISFT